MMRVLGIAYRLPFVPAAYRHCIWLKVKSMKVVSMHHCSTAIEHVVKSRFADLALTEHCRDTDAYYHTGTLHMCATQTQDCSMCSRITLLACHAE